MNSKDLLELTAAGTAPELNGIPILRIFLKGITTNGYKDRVKRVVKNLYRKDIYKS